MGVRLDHNDIILHEGEGCTTHNCEDDIDHHAAPLPVGVEVYYTKVNHLISREREINCFAIDCRRYKISGVGRGRRR